MEFAKEDIFFGIVAEEFEPQCDFEHFIGYDRNSLSLSVRTGTAWHDGQEVGNVKRIEYLKMRSNKAQKTHNIQQTTEDVDALGSDSMSSPSLVPLCFPCAFTVVLRECQCTNPCTYFG